MPRHLATAIACLALVALALVGMSACATTRSGPPRLPPLLESATGDFHPGKFVWVDLLTGDVAAAREFYGALFGWTFEDDGDYVTVLDDGTAIAGMVQLDGASTWMGSLSVADVDAAVAFAKAHGGALERGPLDAPERGRMAMVSDPGGAEILLVRSSTGDPPDVRPEPGRWLWRELWTHDTDAAIAFYSQMLGYEPETVEIDGERYRVLRHSGVPRAGVVQAPDEVTPQWLPWLRVEDAPATVARARSLGARIYSESADSAILVDPSGAAIGVQVWERAAPEDL